MKRIIALVAFTIVAAVSICRAQTLPAPRAEFRDRLAWSAVWKVYHAEIAYRDQVGAGNFAPSLSALVAAGLLDQSFAAASRGGYDLALSAVARTATLPPTFVLTATPARYPKTGRLSFRIDERGRFTAADVGGLPAAEGDSADASECPLFGGGNETCVIADLRQSILAEIRFAAQPGVGRFADFAELHDAGLLKFALGRYVSNGYRYAGSILDPGQGGGFIIMAAPTEYGVTGRLSYYFDTSGNLRAADAGGAFIGGANPVVATWPF